MASLFRVARQSYKILSNTSQKAALIRQARVISTSKKNKDAISVNEAAVPEVETQENLLEKEENWISFG